MSWYRTYRPQTIAELNLQSSREALERVRKSGIFSHAYLFAGPKGTGKTSSARILAKMLNCEKNAKQNRKEPFKEPCNACHVCLRITQGSSLSVVEMDAASNRGIDDIRTLRERLNLAPSEGRYTVYIIDEVHMLTTEAFNALLKVLEEPPKHVVFILATTEFHKLPETIVSRCTLVRFRKAGEEELSAALSAIAKSENIAVTKEHLARIAEYADGSFRDAVKLFEHIAQGKKKLTNEDIEAGFSGNVSLEVERCVEALLDGNAKEIVDVFSSLEQHDADVNHFQKLLLENLHAKMLSALGSPEEARRFAEMMGRLDVPPNALLPIPHLPLELACITLCLGRGGYEEPEKQVKADESREKKDKEEEGRAANAAPPSEEESIQGSLIAIEELSSIWSKILEVIRSQNASLEALLKATRPKSIQGKTVTIEVFYRFHKDQLSQEKYRKIVEQIISEMCGIPNISLFFVLGEKQPLQRKADTAGNTATDADLVSVAEEAFL